MGDAMMDALQHDFHTTMQRLLDGKQHAPCRIAVAVSGGADSFALLHLAQQWAASHQHTLYAFTVDHALRAESASEAATVQQWCKPHHIPHETLVWDGIKPKTGIQDAARNKRRALLFQACRQQDIPVLLMGHQADDQAETMLMRMQRGSGLGGMGGIHETRQTEDGITLLRPLLSFRRAALRGYARHHNLPFCDDPSNENPVYERAALRKILGQLPELADGATRTAARLRHAEDALTALATSFYDTHHIQIDSATWLPRDLLLAQPFGFSLHILAHAMHQHAPGTTWKLHGLENLLQALKHPDFTGKTLGGLHIRAKVWKKTPGFLIETAPMRRFSR